MMFGVDALLLCAVLADAILLPAPESFTLTRRFLHAPELGSAVPVELETVKSASGLHTVVFLDDLHTSMLAIGSEPRLTSYPNEVARAVYQATPSLRGDLAMGKLYLRYRSVFALVERWAVADLRQTVRVFAAGERASESSELFLLRAKQIELEKRRLRRLGLGPRIRSHA